MTDGIGSAIVSTPARQAFANDRSSLQGGDEQADFGQALLDPKKGGEHSAKEPRVDAGAQHEKRWQKFAERLAAKDAGDVEGTVERDVAANDDAKIEDAETTLPDPVAKEPAANDQNAEAAMPLVLALSELRKAASQPAASGGAQSTSGDAGDAAVPTEGTDAALADGQPFASGKSAARPNGGSALPPALAGATDAATTGEAAAQAKPAGDATGEAAAPADKPARPTPARQPEQAAATNRVTVISEQMIPAPATPSTGSTAGALALAIASGAPRQTAAVSAVQQLQANSSSTPGTQVLKIQLRPVELGMVTASLHLSGDQLSVEIQVENAEAYNRLSTDRDAINSALRGLGFDVDRVTIQQPQAAANSQARADGDALSPGSGGRDQQAFQSGGTGSEGRQSGNGRTTGGATNEEGGTRNIQSPRADGIGGSRYI